MSDLQQTFSGPGPDAVFAAALAEGKFLIQHCAACDRHVFYPRVICPHCGAPALAWQPASGAGTVYATTVVRRKPDHGGDYNVALIDLAEGPRMMSRVDGVAPADVRIGMVVSARIIDDPRHGRLVVFTPHAGAAA